MAGHGNSRFIADSQAFFFLTGKCVFSQVGGGAWKNIHRDLGEGWGLREAGLVVRSKARRPPSLWAALTTHKQSPIYNIWFTKGGEGENVSVHRH